jgi:hypothetical protein
LASDRINFSNDDIFITNSFEIENSLIGSTKIYKECILNSNMKKRVSFPKGNQKKFIKYMKNSSNLKWSKLASKLCINENTLSKSYFFESCDMPYEVFKKIIKIVDKNEEDILRDYGAKVKVESLIIGRKCFGEQKKVLEPINITFENKNLNLDISDVNYSKSDLNKGIKLPTKLTPELAEEIGMHSGDGFLSAKRYDYRLKGNPRDEKEYYNYIQSLFKRLYNLDVNLKESYKSFGFELYSQAFWEFKIKVIGIKPGKKEDIFLPNKLKVNDVRILAGFIRGLFDTDGSLCFKTKYGYERYYPEISISLISKQLIQEVGEILKMIGLKPRVYFNERYGRISIYGINALKRYEELIGWSSQKNLNKLNDWRNRYPMLV